MKKLIIPLLSLVLFVVSCSKDENKSSETTTDPIETFFSLNLEAESFKRLKDGYILLNDAEGNVLGHEKMTEAKKYEFKSKKSKLKGSFLLTFLLLKKDEAQKVFKHSAISIQNVPLNSNWNMVLGDSREEDNPKIKFFLKVESSVNSLSVNPYIKVGSSYETNISSGSSGATSYTITKADKYVITAEENNVFKYYWLENVKANETRSLSFKDDFKNYASSLSIIDNSNYETISYNTSILENSYEATVFSGYFNKSYNTHTPKLYFTTEKGRYETTVNASNYSNGNQKGIYRYKKIGAKPTASIIIPKANLSVTQKAFFDTKFTTDVTDYTFVDTVWVWTNRPEKNPDHDKSYSSIDWNVVTNGNNTFKAPKIPEDIKTKYPNFDTTKLKYRTISIRKGLTYQEFLDEQFGFNLFNKESYITEEFGF